MDFPKEITNDQLPLHRKKLDCFLDKLRKLENEHSIFLNYLDLKIVDQAHRCDHCQTQEIK